MTSFTTGCAAPGGWQWPEGIPGKETESPADSAGTTRSSSTHESTNPAQAEGDRPQQHRERQKQRKHWKPRTCRICLETVLPTFQPLSENLPDFLQSTPKVSYDSEGGRLIRPCQCKGSSRYVHEDCLQAWRHADPDYGNRNFWQCPTCGYKYRLERMEWGRWISSKAAQVVLTVLILVFTVFALGFIADPIINLYVDPMNSIASSATFSSGRENVSILIDEDEDDWFTHFVKGFASLGVLGFVKVFFTVSPWHWFNLRGTGIFGSSNGRAGTTGRERATSISWVVLLLGVCTFLYAVWKGVRAWSRRFLETARERVMDVQGDDGNDADEQD